MANSQKNNKNLIIGICSAVAAVAIIAVVAIVLATRGGNPTLNDDYFVSDDSKYVITMDSEQSDDEINAEKTHIVYNYSGNDITAVKYYYEFTDAAAAKTAYNSIKDSIGSLYKSVDLDGKYVILTSNEADYEGMTAEDVEQQIEFMKLIEDMDLDEDADDIIEGTVEGDSAEEL